MNPPEAREPEGPSLKEETIQTLRRGLHGPLLRPGDNGYDGARRLYNAMIDRRPGLIVQAAGVSDVVRTVNFARENNLLLAVKGGGHSLPGLSVCDGGIMLDLSRMRSIRVDPTRRTARAEPGVRFSELDHETQAFGLATPGGVVSTTGIAGLTLGGGFGWLASTYGLTCDNLLSADVVTAEGELVTASASENADLFWGLRGGGGNFGVVTSFEYRLHPVGPKVFAGDAIYPFAKTKEVLRFYREFSQDPKRCPDELGMIPFLFSNEPLRPEFHGAFRRGEPAVGLSVCYSGSLEEGEKVVKPLREFGPPAVDLLMPMNYVDVQRFIDPFAPPGRHHYWKASFFQDLPDPVLDAIVRFFAEVPSPLTQVIFELHHGAIARVPPDATAYCHRSFRYQIVIISMWTDPAKTEENIEWTRRFHAALEPYSMKRVYMNFLSKGEERLREAYDEATLARLVALKNKYDSTNLFRLNHNIKPTTPPPIAAR